LANTLSGAGKPSAVASDAEMARRARQQGWQGGAAEEKNAENLLVIQDAPLSAQYTANWAEHLKHSVLYLGR
jgi:hypothetical protein